MVPEPDSNGGAGRMPVEDLAAYLIELREQCALSLTAFAELRALVQHLPPVDDESRRIWNRRVWLRIHAMLSASSTVARLLWPNPQGAQRKDAEATLARGARLRKFLKLAQGPPESARRARNAFAHVDEQLDSWLREGQEGARLGWVLSSLDKKEEPSFAASAFRYYNINLRELRIGSEVCDLGDLVSWVESVDDTLPHEAQMVYQRMDREGRIER